jgi:hypothetical protein
MIQMLFLVYILFGCIFYNFFMRMINEMGGLEAVNRYIGDSDTQDIDFNNPRIRFLMFLMLVLLWPILIILATFR